MQCKMPLREREAAAAAATQNCARSVVGVIFSLSRSGAVVSSWKRSLLLSAASGATTTSFFVLFPRPPKSSLSLPGWLVDCLCIAPATPARNRCQGEWKENIIKKWAGWSQQLTMPERELSRHGAFFLAFSGLAWKKQKYNDDEGASCR